MISDSAMGFYIINFKSLLQVNFGDERTNERTNKRMEKPIIGDFENMKLFVHFFDELILRKVRY